MGLKLPRKVYGRGENMLKKKTKSYEIDMTNGAILPKLLQFAMPLALSSMLQLLFNAADIVVVGRYAGDNALAAVGSCGSLVGLLTNLFIGMSVGANILAARYYGADDKQAIHQTVHTAMTISVLSGIILAIVGVSCARTILVWMQCPDEVIDLAALYLRIYFGGMPAMMVYNFGAALLRAAGDTKRPLYYLTIAGVINVGLNLFFVIVCNMSVDGVGLATVISQCVSAFLVVRCLMGETSAIRLELAKLRIYKDKFVQILKIGLPAGVQGILFSLSNAVIQSSINSFGEVIMAGNSAGGNIESFIYVCVNSIYQANVAFTSQNMGARKYHRVTKIALCSMLCSAVIATVLGCTSAFFGRQLVGIYSTSADVIAAGITRLKIMAVPYALCGLMDVMVGSVRGLGYNIMPMLVSLMGACGIRILWISTIFQLPQFHNINTVYLSYPLSWGITFLSHLVCFIIVYRKLMGKVKNGQLQPALD